MRFSFSIQGDVEATIQKRLKQKERQVTKAVVTVAKEVQAGMRGQILDAGLGKRLANSVRAESFPKVPSLNAAANIWTNAPHILGAFEKGVVIHARDGFWLAIPTDEAGKSRKGGRITPQEWMQRNGVKLTPIFRPGKPALLVAEMRKRTGKRGGYAMPSASSRRTGRGLATVVIFVLVPQTRLGKRLDLKREAERGRARLTAMLSRSSEGE